MASSGSGFFSSVKVAMESSTASQAHWRTSAPISV
jgi:hypothetical protein